MVIECTDKTDESALSAYLESVGAKEINTQVAEDGWWIGRYDREQKLYNEPTIA
jgi:hypothetical protein